MDEGEQNGAEAFDAHHHVLVFLHALHVAFVAAERAAGHAHALAGPEILFAVDAAPRGVGCREQPQQLHGALRHLLHLLRARIAVYPEGGHGLPRFLTALPFHGQGDLFGGADEEHAWDNGTHARAAVAAFYALLREVHLAAPGRQLGLGLESLAGADGKPLFRVGQCRSVVVHASILQSFCTARGRAR